MKVKWHTEEKKYKCIYTLLFELLPMKKTCIITTVTSITVF